MQPDVHRAPLVVQKGKESACNVGDLGLIPGSGRSPGERNGNPLQYSCLENPMERGAWWRIPWKEEPGGHKESDVAKQLSLHFTSLLMFMAGFPGGSVVKNPPADVRDADAFRGSGRSPGEGSGNPLQYACLGSPWDRGAWWTTVLWVTKESDMTQ